MSSVDASHVMYAVGVLPTPDFEAPVRAQLKAVKAALGPWAAAQMFANLTETSQPSSALWPERSYRRLQEIKAVVDPDDVIRSNHPVPPAAR